MSYLYVIGSSSKVKIGHSKNPEKRLKQLQTGNETKLKLHYIEEFEDSKIKMIEDIVHRLLSSKKVLGEWFNITPEEAIDNLKFAQIRYGSDDSVELFYKNGRMDLLLR